MPVQMNFLPSIKSDRRRALSWSLEEARVQLSRDRHTFTEVLKDQMITKIYLDYDFVLNEGCGSANVPPDGFDDIVRHHRGLVERRVEFIEERLIYCLKDQADDVSYVIASRHGWCPTKNRWKISFRPFFNGVRIQYDQIPLLLQGIAQMQAEHDVTFWDTSVYKPSEQLLACINGIKSCEDPRQLISEGGDVSDYVAQVVNENWQLMALLPGMLDVLTEKRFVHDVPASSSNMKSGVSVDILQIIASGLSDERAAVRDSWLKTVWAIHAVSAENGYEEDGLKIALSFSQRCVEKCKEREVRAVYWQGRISGRCFGIGSLLLWHKADNPAAGHQLVKDLLARGGFGDYRYVDPEDSVQAVQRPLHVDRDIVRGTFGMVCEALHLSEVDESTNVDTHLTGVDESAKDADHILEWTMHFKLVASRKFAKPDILHVEVRFSDLQLTVNDQFVEFLHTRIGITIEHSMARIDGTSGTDTTWTARRVCEGLLQFTSSMQAQINVLNFNLPINERSAQLVVPGGLTRAKSSVAHMKWLDDAHKSGIRSLLIKDLGLGSLFVVQNGNNNNITFNVANGRSSTDSRILRDLLINFARQRGLRKINGFVFRPVEGCRCAFVSRCTYEEYINEVLKDDDVFLSRAGRNLAECVQLLEGVDATHMPWLKVDVNLLSFADGVLELAENEFTTYTGMNQAHKSFNSVARHHIPHPYSHSPLTPLLDTVLDAQFDHDVANVLCALIGRTFFKVNQLDQWQVMPFLVGVGGTGKSLLLNVVSALFSDDCVGSLAAKREEVFGMANLIDKEIIIGRDMPAKMSGSLPQEIMQCMTAGEKMEVPRKGTTALHKVWTSHVIIAGNHYPDYQNTGNNIGRRMVTIRFDNVIEHPDESLERNILKHELPNVVCRCLQAYHQLRIDVKAARGFWKVVPEILLEWRSKLSASTNKLAMFLSMDDRDRHCVINRVEGRITFVSAFEKVFEDKMGKGTYVSDPAVFAELGYRVSTSRSEREMICRFCNQISKARGGMCCPRYDHGSRRPVHVIHNMDLTPYFDTSVM